MTPDIDIHGHHAVTTGVSDQKFGFTLGGDHAADAVQRLLAHPILDLVGLPCHIGSQVSEPNLYGEAIRRMVRQGRRPRPAGRHPHRAEHRQEPRHPVCLR